jgi:hypothetical protein
VKGWTLCGVERRPGSAGATEDDSLVTCRHCLQLMDRLPTVPNAVENSDLESTIEE